MGFPQVTSRLISAPVQALRTVFGGIGRVVTAADRPPDSHAGTTGRPARPDQARRPDGRASQGNRATAKSGRRAASPAPSRWRSLDETGNVRLLTADDLDNGDGDGDGDGQARQLATPAAANDTVGELPLPGYDDLTLPSIRARLRGLHPAQLRVLIAHESTHAERPEVLGMLERRIEKLEAGG